MICRMNRGRAQAGNTMAEEACRRTPSLGLSGLCLLIGLQAGCASHPPAPTALQQLQGTWSGVIANNPKNERYTIRIRGDSFHFHRDTNFWFETTITLPPGKEPKQLHATIRNSAGGTNSNVGEIVFAIFKIEEETLILATRGTDSDDPPLSFENSNDRGLTRYELKRVQDVR